MNIRRNLIAAGVVAVVGAGAFLAYRLSSEQATDAEDTRAGMVTPESPERMTAQAPQYAEGRAPLPSEGVGSYPRTPEKSAKQ